MDFDKYSKAAFESCGLNSEAARALADQLQADVNTELHAAVFSAFQKVITELNARGHHLTLYGEIRPGDVSFWDQTRHDDCQLRLAYDVVISAGYSHTVTPQQAAEQFSKDIS
jgi:hypothetical protein